MTIREILNEKEDAIMGNGSTQELIERAEKKLGLSFAEDYKEYLLTVGMVMCNGHELTGLGKASRTNVVDVTKEMKIIHDNIPDDWYVIENVGMDGAVMWQDSKGAVYFNDKKECNSFSEFILKI